ncbi:MAG TPA: hypothetical protein PLN63_08605 [Paludibacteraceae bacterium]|nr:hypothetical protein [Paludibacteraceae bacterium]
MDKETRKEKKRLEQELKLFLDNYKEVAVRGEQIKKYFDEQIELIVEMLKRIGK